MRRAGSQPHRTRIGPTSLRVGLSALAVVLLTGGSTGASNTATSTATPTSTAISAAQLGSQEIPVLGSTTLYQDMTSAGVKAIALVHGVRRISGATVVYYSVGLPAGAQPCSWSDFNATAYDQVSDAHSGLGNVRLVDFADAQIYTPLQVENDYGSAEPIASPNSAWPSQESGGTFYVFYAVLAELPADVTSVDVMIGHGDIVHDVKVSDGLLEPALQQDDPIRTGEGWPLVDQADVAAAITDQSSVNALQTGTAQS